MSAVDHLRREANTYELNALAAKERGDTFAEAQFVTIAIVLHEVAFALEAEREEAEAA